MFKITEELLKRANIKLEKQKKTKIATKQKLTEDKISPNKLKKKQN